MINFKSLVPLFGLSMILGFSACEKDVGEEVGDKVEDVGDKTEDVVDDAT